LRIVPYFAWRSRARLWDQLFASINFIIVTGSVGFDQMLTCESIDMEEKRMS